MNEGWMKDDFLLQVQRSCNPAEVSQPPAKRDGGNADRLPVLTLLPSRTLCSGARLWGRDLRASRSTLRQSRSPRSFPAGTSCLLSTRLPPTPDVVGRPLPSYFLGAATTTRLRRCAQRTRARRAKATRALPEGPQSVLVSAARGARAAGKGRKPASGINLLSWL